MGSYDYLWRIKDQFLSARFPDCYKGPEFYALCAGEQARRMQMYKQRRWDEFWYMFRDYGRKVRWAVLKFLGFRPY